MDLVANESCAGPVIRALRAAGHDVLAIAESAQGAGDEAVIARTFSEGRVLITEDRDFGELVYARGHWTAGVVFVKFPSRVRTAKPARWSRRWQNWRPDCATPLRSLNQGGYAWAQATARRRLHSCYRTLALLATCWHLR
jgi:uncharacterized protein with PIN domain